MLTGTVWGLTLILVGLVATIAAAQVVLAGVFARRMARTRQSVASRPGLCALIGLAAALPLVGIPALIAKAAEFGGALGFSFSILVALLGLGAVAAELGSRLPSQGPASSPWRTMIRGSIALSLASLLPVAGWFIVFPAAVLVGLGAWTRSFFRPDGDGATSPDRPSRAVDVASPPLALAAAHPEHQESAA